MVPLYKEVAQMLFDQHKEGETNPGKLLNAFTDSEEQREVASLLTLPFIWKTKENSRGLFPMRCFGSRKKASKKKPYLGSVRHDRASGTDKSKKELEDLGRKRQQLHISFN